MARTKKIDLKKPITKKDESPKLEYYSFRLTLNNYPDAKYFVIFGERSNGKSYSVLEYCVEEFYNSSYSNSFGYIRRWKDDTTASLMYQVFKSLKSNDKHINVIEKITKGEFNEVIVNKRCFYLAHKTDEGEIDNVLDKQPLGYIFSLSESERVKSTGYPDIKTIFFDEFIAEGLPMINEFSRFRSLLSTIIRNRDDVIVILAGNTVNKHNVYFNEFGMKKAKYQKPGTIDVYKYPDEDGKELLLVSDYADFPQRKKIKKSNIYFAFDKEKNAMIRQGDWDIGSYPHLEYFYKPNDIKLIYFIKFEGEIYQAEIITVLDNEENKIYPEENEKYSNKRITFTYIHKKTTSIKYPHEHIIFQPESSSLPNIRNSIDNAYDEITKFIRSYFISNKVMYQDNDVGDAINAFMNL